MKVKRFIAALVALCVLAAPAAFAATVANTGGSPVQNHAQAKAAAVAARTQALRAIAARRNVFLARTLARRQGTALHRGYARRAHHRPLRALQRSNTHLRLALRALRRERIQQRRARVQQRAAFASVPKSTLDAIAACESHGNPRAIGGGGAYRGMFQMTYQIWAAVGGSGDPAAAPAGEQYYRAALVYQRYGSGQWPVCGR